MNIVLYTALFALAYAFCLGAALGFFKQVFAVQEDPLIGKIKEILPGVNCGGCGFPGCDGFAAALAKGEAEPGGCPPGGQSVAEKLAGLLGGSADLTPLVAVLACAGTHGKALPKGEYVGVKSCRAAKLATGSIKLCAWGCQGFGDCVRVCKFGAITMGENGLPGIDADKCTGCKLCARECPQPIIQMVPKGQKGARALCANANAVKAQVTKSCKAGCFKCEMCVKNCPENCMEMVNGIPAVDYTKCTSCGVCVSKCPVKVMTLN